MRRGEHFNTFGILYFYEKEMALCVLHLATEVLVLLCTMLKSIMYSI